MLSITNQKEIILDRLCSAMNRASNTAKMYRSLKIFDKAAKYYHKAAAYNKSILLIKLLEPEGNNLTFENFPFI